MNVMTNIDWSYVPDKKDGRKNDGKNDRTSKLLLNKFTGTVIFTIIFTSIFFYPEHSLYQKIWEATVWRGFSVLYEKMNYSK